VTCLHACGTCLTRQGARRRHGAQAAVGVPGTERRIIAPKADKRTIA